MQRATVISQFNPVRLPLHEVIPLASPLVVYIEPSSFCNLECRFCPQHIAPEGLKKQNMSLSSFRKLVADIKKFPTRPKKIRYCGTGEPLFNKNLLAMVKMAAEADLAENFELITNAFLLNDDLITELPKYLDKIIISVEGLSSSDYKTFSLRNVDYDELVDKVRRLCAQPNRRATIHVKTHHTAIKNEDDRQLFLSTFGKNADEINIEGLVEMWPEIRSNLNLDETNHRFEGDINSVVVCPQIFKGLQINSDGRVIPCCADWAAINVIGDITNEPLLEIWHGQLLKSLQTRHLKGERDQFSPCKGCQMNEFCEKDNIDSYRTDLLAKLD